VLSLADLTQVAIDTEHWIFGDELSSPVSAPVEALFLACLTFVLAVWLFRRTERVVRG